jgi:hypothetical protein
MAPFGGAIFSDAACTTKLSDLGLACLDLGGGNAVNVPPGPVVDGASNVFDLSAPNPQGVSNLLASAGTGQFDCTKENCFFGPPLPIANGGLSTCVINVIETDASGIVNLCTGESSVDLPLFSRTHLTGNDTSPCPKCISGTCNAGPRAGLACTPVGTQLTTHDCPPDPGGLLAPFPVNLNPLSTAPVSKIAGDGNFCPGQAASPPAAGFSGAFGFGGQDAGHPLAECIQENGTSAGDLTDGPVHMGAVLASVFCIPATGSVAIDGAADLPGPGGITLPVNTQALP